MYIHLSVQCLSALIRCSAAFAGAATTRLLETEGRAVYDKYKVEHQGNEYPFHLSS